MHTLEVVFDPAPVYLGGDGIIMSRVHLRLDELRFPEESWVDFPIPLLTQWLSQLLPLLELHKSEAALEFTEGPFRARVSAGSPSLWNIMLIEDRLHGPQSLGPYKVHPGKFLKSVLAFTDHVLKICAQNDCGSSQIMELTGQRARFADAAKSIA